MGYVVFEVELVAAIGEAQAIAEEGESRVCGVVEDFCIAFNLFVSVVAVDVDEGFDCE